MNSGNSSRPGVDPFSLSTRVSFVPILLLLKVCTTEVLPMPLPELELLAPINLSLVDVLDRKMAWLPDPSAPRDPLPPQDMVLNLAHSLVVFLRLIDHLLHL